MALYPNGRYLTRSPGRHFGPGPGLEVAARSRSDRLNQFVNAERLKTASTPDGYGTQALVPPLIAGSMSAKKPVATLCGQANLLSGAPMSGSFASALVGSGNLSLIVGLSGSGIVVRLSGAQADLKLTMALTGQGEIALTGQGNLSLIVPFAARSGSKVLAFAGQADLKGLCSLAGSFSPFTELSPQNLANAVWSALASQFDTPGSMGARLNAASAGGVDLSALAAAILAALQATAIPVNVKQINDTPVTGAGVDGDEWGPA